MSSAKSSKTKSKAKSVSLSLGSVPKRAPKYLSGFLQYVSTTVYSDKPKSQAELSHCEALMDKLLTKHWANYQEYVSSRRPEKKQRVESAYNESKLSRDAKAIITKFETMEQNLDNLNSDEIHEHVHNIYLHAKQIYRAVKEGTVGGGDVREANEGREANGGPTAGPIDWCGTTGVATTNVVPIPMSIVSENTDTQTAIKPEPSTTTPNSQPLPTSSLPALMEAPSL